MKNIEGLFLFQKSSSPADCFNLLSGEEKSPEEARRTIDAISAIKGSVIAEFVEKEVTNGDYDTCNDDDADG